MGRLVVFFSCFLFSAQMFGQKVTLTSVYLQQEREIMIKLPEGYKDSKANYPIVLVTDGEVLFDYVNGLFTYNWDIYSEVILVGIYQNERGKELVPAKKFETVHDQFTKFVFKELLAKLNTEYRTNGIVMVVGHSFGGYFSLLSLLTRSEVQYAISISPSLWGNYQKTIQEEITNSKLSDQKWLYLGVADGDHEIVRKNTEGLHTRLSNEEFSMIESEFSLYSNENHNSSVLIGVRKGLKNLFENWITNFPDEKWKELKEQKKPELFYSFFEGLSKKIGKKITPKEDDLNTLGYYFLEQKRLQEAIKVFQENIRMYSHSSNTYDSLADAYEENGNLKEALKMVRQALKVEKAESNDFFSVQQYQERIDELLKKIDK